MADPMPTSYETNTTTTTKSSTNIGFHKEYLKTIPGILKIVEIVLDLIIIICVSIVYMRASGWFGFLYGSAIVLTIILFASFLFGLIYKMPGPWPLFVFVFYLVYTILFLITSIVLAVYGWVDASIAAACFFSFAATAVYAVDTFFMFREWRNGPTVIASTTTSTTVTTVDSTQY
ncbi:plasmolipin-like [Tubulanus polymorphus]|uniref:plasmolipin-like n=1 Tax=Tubulanus polymorphus TaxID=672921 RepID=UPI003DA44755